MFSPSVRSCKGVWFRCSRAKGRGRLLPPCIDRMLNEDVGWLKSIRGQFSFFFVALSKPEVERKVAVGGWALNEVAEHEPDKNRDLFFEPNTQCQSKHEIIHCCSGRVYFLFVKFVLSSSWADFWSALRSWSSDSQQVWQPQEEIGKLGSNVATLLSWSTPTWLQIRNE